MMDTKSKGDELRSSKRSKSNDWEESMEDEQKNEPISLEELRDKMREREKALSRPAFLSKEQRMQIALKKREEVAAEKMKRLEAIHKEREEIFAGRRSDSKEEKRIVAERYLQLRKDDVSQQELEKIKTKYLGAKPQKKKVIKPSEKFKFNFAWDMAEDTAPDTNPLYDKPYEAQLLFGRGFRAGIDSREQIQKQIDYEEISKDRKDKIVEWDKDEKKRREREAVKELKERESRQATRRRRLAELRRLRANGKLSEEEEHEMDTMLAHEKAKTNEECAFSLREPVEEKDKNKDEKRLSEELDDREHHKSKQEKEQSRDKEDARMVETLREKERKHGLERTRR